jgi:hypothetical protein
MPVQGSGVENISTLIPVPDNIRATWLRNNIIQTLLFQTLLFQTLLFQSPMAFIMACCLSGNSRSKQRMPSLRNRRING